MKTTQPIHRIRNLFLTFFCTIFLGVTSAQSIVVTAINGAAVGTQTLHVGALPYDILSAITEPYNTDLKLTLHIRMLNEWGYPVNFWDESFRLVVNGNPIAPVSGLNEVIEDRASKEANIEFIIPATTQQAILKIDELDNIAELPLYFGVPATNTLGNSAIMLLNGQVGYDIIQSRVDPYNTGNVRLSFWLRMSNYSEFPANFWDDSFRLSANGLIIAPVSNLNVVVDGKSTQEGMVSFVLPKGIYSGSLNVSYQDDSTAVPVAFSY